MTKHYIVINLNKAESADTRMERVRDQVRWVVFSVLLILMLGINFQVWMVSFGYNDIIDQKQLEIGRLKEEINKLVFEENNFRIDIINVTLINDKHSITHNKNIGLN